MIVNYRYYFLILCFHLLVLRSNAQENLIYTGLLVDSTTQKPVPFAHIIIGEIVSVSNQYGNFSIGYSATDTKTVVKFSCIGYKSKELTLSVLLRYEKISLTQDVTILNEIVISELTAQAILKKAEKKGFKNYTTPRYSANYTFDQFIFFEDADSLIATSREIGVVINRGLDTTATYPKFTKEIQRTSVRFFEFDTIPNQLTTLTKQRNTVRVELAYSFDPIRIGLLKQFHAVPAIFSKGFYDNTDLNILSIVKLDNKEYYLISVYPKFENDGATLSKEESKQLALYKDKIKELAAKSGRAISDKKIDSIFSPRLRNKPSTSYVSGFLLVDVKTYGIIHALIKVNTFDQTGKLYAKLHVSASYMQYGKSYYLQNIDILTKRTSPDYRESANLYYLTSLNLSTFQTNNLSKSTLVKDPLADLRQQLAKESLIHLKMEDVEQFLTPVKNCVSCKRNPLILFGQSFE